MFKWIVLRPEMMTCRTLALNMIMKSWKKFGQCLGWESTLLMDWMPNFPKTSHEWRSCFASKLVTKSKFTSCCLIHFSDQAGCSDLQTCCGFWKGWLRLHTNYPFPATSRDLSWYSTCDLQATFLLSSWWAASRSSWLDLAETAQNSWRLPFCDCTGWAL